ncbi:MAG: BrnT family toxin [Deltaproteobacteria bacterium]|nr:BrnT family toxin [Deltaproteobacteria bacterium]
MEFEWHSEKSVKNKQSHGVSFDEATLIWQEPHIDIINIAYAKNEYRSATMGKIFGRLYVAIWTKRNNKIRLISVRRARKNEEKIYNQKI